MRRQAHWEDNMIKYMKPKKKKKKGKKKRGY